MVGIVGLSNGNNIDLVDAWVAFFINALVVLFSIHTLSFKVRICVLSPCTAAYTILCVRCALLLTLSKCYLSICNQFMCFHFISIHLIQLVVCLSFYVVLHD